VHNLNEPGREIKWVSGDAYEPYVGRWSRLVAQGFLEWLAMPRNLRWLDVGCGTGALSRTVLVLASPAEVRGIDPSQGYVDYARAHVDEGRVRFDVGNATSLPYGPGYFDVAASGLVLNFVPEPATALSEMVRITKRGGVVAAYVWDYAGEMQVIRHFWKAAMMLDPSAAQLDEGRRFRLCKPEPLRELFQDAGLRRVQTRAIDVMAVFRDFEDYWSPFLGGQGPAPGYAMSLDEEDRSQLRELIRSRLPVDPDGSIRLLARAWAVRGRA
jgi:ubiquinone/menaquinone biosynthesis C-methylase UbiE